MLKKPKLSFKKSKNTEFKNAFDHDTAKVTSVTSITFLLINLSFLALRTDEDSQ